jgi:hypothetical protein
MATHIKRDGQFICLIGESKKSLKRFFAQYKDKYNYVSFSDAIKMKDTSKLCGECQKKFFEKINNMKNPIQVD